MASSASDTDFNLEVLNVEESPDLDLLEDARIDAPRQGQTAGSVLRMAGWILGKESPAVAIEIVFEERVVRVAGVGIDRPDIAAAHPRLRWAPRAGFRAQVNARSLPADFELRIVALLANGSKAPVGSMQARRIQSGQSFEHPPTEDRPSTKPALKRVLDLNGETLLQKDQLLDRLSVKGQKVLDLGSGLGYRCREARARGAEVVDGFERDADRLQVARLLNAYHDVTRVSFFQRDVTDPDSYSERYDVILATAVPLDGVMETIAGVTDSIFAIELDDEKGDHSTLLSSIESAFGFVEIASGSEGRHYVIARQDSMGALGD